MLPWIAGGWLIGLLVGARWQPESAPLLLGGAFAVGLALALHGRDLRARLWAVPLAMLSFACGVGVSPPYAIPCRVSGEVAGRARVESVRHGPSEARVSLRLLEGRRVESGLRLPAGLPIVARVRLDQAPPPGSVVALHTEVHPRTILRNPSPHPRLLPPHPAACWASSSDGRPLAIDAPPLSSTLERLRRRVRAHALTNLSEQGSAVVRALVLGDGGALGYERRRTIAAVGLAHLFAVSGLHVGLVSGTLVAVLRWLLSGCVLAFDSRRLAAALGVPLTLLHASFAGGSPSAWRAAVTAALTWTLIAVNRRPSPVHVTAGAALVLSGPDPATALRPAFLLSIVATSAILSAPRLPNAGLRWLRGAATISARTLVATTPMVWWWFGGVPLIGWLTNIVVLPFGSWVVIPLAHLFSLTSLWDASVAPLRWALERAVHALLSACVALESLAWSQRLPPLDPAQGLVVLGACALLLLVRAWSWRLLVVASAAVLWLAAERALVAREHPRGELRVTFVDVGQGDAALVDLPDGRLALIDTGRGEPHPGSRELRRLLRARRRARIDLLVITHGHPDHFGALADLLDETVIGEIWLNGQLLAEERQPVMEALLNRALRLGTRLRFAPELCGNRHFFGSAVIEVLWPCPRYDPALGLNDNSLTLRLRYGPHSILFPGDLEAEGERRLLRAGALGPVDVLKVGHHGSRSSTKARWLAVIRPSVAVISSGAGNRYGHPSPEVVQGLRTAGAKVLRTDLGGGVIVTADGERLTIRR